MLESLNIMWSNGRSKAFLEAGLPLPIEVRPIRGAKRLRLRFDEASGTLKLLAYDAFVAKRPARFSGR